ncbi:MAG: type II toxin-antitoxin system HicA family toxin [Desulfovibrio sp.]|nr:type II toxin-antitoxin system HicA family toxin [Desulfovibrio sp.]
MEVLLLAAGSSLQEGRGSRVRFIYEGKVITFNRPHPEKKPGFIKSVTQKIPFGYGSFSLKKMTRKIIPQTLNMAMKTRVLWGILPEYQL